MDQFLVVLRKVRGSRPALANDVHVLAVADTVDIDPCLHRDSVAVAKVEIATPTRVLYGEEGAFAIEIYRGIARFEVGEFRRNRPSLIALDVSVGDQRR